MRRAPAVRTCFLLGFAAAVLTPADARADDPVSPRSDDVEAADGAFACSELETKNDRERAAFTKQQPPIPYRYPQREKILGAPWGELFRGLDRSWRVIVATVIPHVGAQLRADTPAALLSWPWSVPIGPDYTCTRRSGSFTMHAHKNHRVLFEPGIVSGNRGVGVFVRPGYRFIHQPSDWVVGVGGGLGSTFEIAGNREPFRPSLSPEVVAHFGRCCEPGYFTLAFRYDHFFGGDVRDIIGGSLGFVYF